MGTNIGIHAEKKDNVIIIIRIITSILNSIFPAIISCAAAAPPPPPPTRPLDGLLRLRLALKPERR